MMLGNMRRNGVRHLIAFCHNDACRHQAIIDVSSYPDDIEVPWFSSRVKCGKCGGSGWICSILQWIGYWLDLLYYLIGNGALPQRAAKGHRARLISVAEEFGATCSN